MIFNEKGRKILKASAGKHESLTKITKEAGITKSHLWKRLKQMENGNILKKVKNGDKNKKVKLTKKGWKVLRKLNDIEEVLNEKE